MTVEPSAAPERPDGRDSMRRMAGDGAAAQEGRPRLVPMED
jgi:hypothetical protein